MDVSSKNLNKNYEEDLSKELEKCKVSKKTKISLEQNSNSDLDSNNSNEESELPSNSLVKLITEQKTKEKTNNMWESSPYKDLPKLQSNNVGIVGENFIEFICNKTDIPVNIDGSKTKKKEEEEEMEK